MKQANSLVCMLLVGMFLTPAAQSTRPVGMAVLPVTTGGSVQTEMQLNPSSCLPPPANMAGWWSGDGNANDIVGNNHGTLQNGTTFFAGKVGQAFSFDGTDDFVEVPDHPSWAFGTGDFTIDLWVNFRQLKIDNPLVSNDEGGGSTNKWIFWVTSNNLNFHLNTSAGESSGVSVPFAPLLNTWYHVAVARGGTTYTFYVNGAPLGSVINPQPVPDANAPLHIGRAESFFTNGLLDEVEIFSRALFASEIQAIFNADSAGKCKFTTVEIDIKPGSFPNSINPGSNGAISVAILTTSTFDATAVDPMSVQFGPAGAMESHRRSHIEDADGDGDLDLVLHFRTQDTGIVCGAAYASLTGSTFGGQAIAGSDSINTVGCK